MKLRKVNQLRLSSLSHNSEQVLRCIVQKVLGSMGMHSAEDTSSAMQLLEAGFLRVSTDGLGRYWLEPTMPKGSKRHVV